MQQAVLEAFQQDTSTDDSGVDVSQVMRMLSARSISSQQVM